MCDFQLPPWSFASCTEAHCCNGFAIEQHFEFCCGSRVLSLWPRRLYLSSTRLNGTIPEVYSALSMLT
jgi:hypothetical protein